MAKITQEQDSCRRCATCPVPRFVAIRSLGYLRIISRFSLKDRLQPTPATTSAAPGLAQPGGGFSSSGWYLLHLFNLFNHLFKDLLHRVVAATRIAAVHRKKESVVVLCQGWFFPHLFGLLRATAKVSAKRARASPSVAPPTTTLLASPPPPPPIPPRLSPARSRSKPRRGGRGLKKDEQRRRFK
jgi:hypothetical protein